MAADTGRHRLHRVTGSVRFRVTVLATLAVIAVLAVGSLALVAGQRRLLRDDLEDRLRQVTVDLVAGGEGRTVDDDGAYQVIGPDGAVVAASDNVIGAAPIADPPQPGRDDAVRTGAVSVDDGEFLIVTRRASDGTVAHAAAPLDDVHMPQRDGVERASIDGATRHSFLGGWRMRDAGSREGQR